ncbi:hypothetical protein BGZ50_007585 [Haplosporangium sp. Z 11]|nr:hypothetical protein BGZ50_007585 [Haplosporangium sp. Z 11]
MTQRNVAKSNSQQSRRPQNISITTTHHHRSISSLGEQYIDPTNSISSSADLDQEKLEDLDHENHGQQPNMTKPLLGNQLPQSMIAEQGQRSMFIMRTNEHDGIDLWSWLTVTRVISEEQRNQELREERRQFVLHQRYLKSIGYHSAGDKNDGGANDERGDRDDSFLDRELNKQTAVDAVKMANAFDMTDRDWIVLSLLTLVTLGVRLWRISWPDEVVSEEFNTGRLVNAHVKHEFAFDVHPPFGKLILAGVSALSNYNGAFLFDNIGDAYLGSVPFVSMRLVMAVMGVFCVPMAYVTLRASGHGASTAIIAALFVAFDNALTANNRLMLLDAPLMFFTAATLMFWNLFMKQSARPFTGLWWAWLLATGVMMAGAMSTKLSGVFTAVTIGLFVARNLWHLASEDSVSNALWMKHFAARLGVLMILPMVIYLTLFHIHFSHQIHQPSSSNPVHAEHDLALLRPLFPRSFISTNNIDSTSDTKVWRDIAFGSVVQLKSESSGGVYLHSFYKASPGGSHQQQVGGYDYPDLNTHWIVILAELDDEEPDEIPSRLQYLNNGDLLRLRHVSTRQCLRSHDQRTYTDPQDKQLHEVVAYGESTFDGDSNDWWVVEIVDTAIVNKVVRTKEPVKALETTFRLRHFTMGCYLFTNEIMLPDPWGEGRKEVLCRSDAGITSKSIWRFTMNEHDYLPMDAPLASYPQLSFWQKLWQTQLLMWSHESAFEKSFQDTASLPIRWPLVQSMIPAWIGYKRQIIMVPNPVVWWVCTLGLSTFLVCKALFLMREKRGFFETGRLRVLKRFHMGDASMYFAGWAIHYLPYFSIHRSLFIHHYFPAFYFSILLACSLLSGFAAFIPRPGRFGMYFVLITLAIWSFVQFSPLTYGSSMSREHCESLRPWVNNLLRGYQGNQLDCTIAPYKSTTPISLSTLKDRTRKECEFWLLQNQQAIAAASAAQATNTAASSRPVPGSENDFLTMEASMPIPVTVHATPPYELDCDVRHRYPHAVKPVPKKPSPVLGLHLPPTDVALPMHNITLLPYQRPPQHWKMGLHEKMLKRWRGKYYQQQIRDLIQQRTERDPLLNLVSVPEK